MHKTNFETNTLELVKNYLSNVAIKKSQKIFKDKRIYLAGPWFTAKDAMLHDTVYNIVYYCSDATVYNPKNNQFGGDFGPNATFASNVKEIKNCDIVIAMIDTKDVGTAWELGMAYALGKDILLVAYDETTFNRQTNLMLAFTGNVVLLKDLKKYMETGNKKYLYEINKTWEAIE